MKMNRKAVTDLPVKLLIISIILSVSIPIISDSLDSSLAGMDAAQMEDGCQKISGAAASAYYSSTGTERYIDIEIPEGCMMVLGGEDREAYAIHMFRGSEEISDYWMDKPMIPFIGITYLSGNVSLRIAADTDGIEVTQL